jgi:hypothetical protein
MVPTFYMVKMWQSITAVFGIVLSGGNVIKQYQFHCKYRGNIAFITLNDGITPCNGSKLRG